MVLFLFLLALSVDGLMNPLRVICRQGQAPFSYVDYTSGKPECGGLIYELWLEMETRLQLPPSILYYANSTSEAYFGSLSVNNATKTSQYDIGLIFGSVTGSRIKIVDFTVTLGETQYVITLLPSFSKDQETFITTLVRQSVMHLFGVLALFVVANVIVLVIFETQSQNPRFSKKPFYAQVFSALEGSLDITLYGATNLYPQTSPVSEITRILTGMAGLFVLSMFAATITSQLTTSQLQYKPPSVDEMRGKKLLIVNTILKDFLQSDRISAIPIVAEDMAVAYEDFYQNGNPKGYDGIINAQAITSYYYDRYGGEAKGYVLSSSFTDTGMNDLRAMVMSRAIPSSIHDAINVQLSKMRDEGYIGGLYRKYVPNSYVAPTSEDDVGMIPVEERQGVQVATLIGCSVMIGVIFVAIVYHYVRVVNTGHVSNTTEGQIQQDSENTSENVCSQMSTELDTRESECLRFVMNGESFIAFPTLRKTNPTQ
eukprot:PhF_6_TR21160/c0_g1_i3/m.30479